MTNGAIVTTARTRANSAGSRRRARRAQKAPSAMRPLDCHSRTSSDVMRKPERTKKVSTPRNPPGSQETPPWKASTPRTATPRRPSSAGWYARRVPVTGCGGERRTPSLTARVCAVPPGGVCVLLEDRPDPAHPRGRRLLLHDPEVPELSGVADVGSAADLLAVPLACRVARGVDGHRGAVAVAEGAECSRREGVVRGHLDDAHRPVARDGVVDDLLHSGELFGRDLRGMREVEAKSLGGDVAPPLDHVVAQHEPERLVEQVRRGVQPGRRGGAVGEAPLEHPRRRRSGPGSLFGHELVEASAPPLLDGQSLGARLFDAELGREAVGVEELEDRVASELAPGEARKLADAPGERLSEEGLLPLEH